MHVGDENQGARTGVGGGPMYTCLHLCRRESVVTTGMIYGNGGCGVAMRLREVQRSDVVRRVQLVLRTAVGMACM